MSAQHKTALPQTGKHWINGEWVDSATVAKSVNPSTGEALGQYSAGAQAEVAAALRSLGLRDERVQVLAPATTTRLIGQVHTDLTAT